MRLINEGFQLEQQIENILGRYVLSSNFGVGTVVSLEEMGGDGKRFLVIESLNNSVKNFIPIEETNYYRFAVSENEFDSIAKNFEGETEVPDFDSKKDRINHYKSASGIQDLDHIVKVLCELRAIDSRSSVEEQIYNRLIETVALEHSVVFKTPIDESTKYVQQLMDLN